MNEAAVREAIEAIVRLAKGSGKAPVTSPLGVYIPTTCSQQSLEEALETVSLHVRYLTFDLEATRRENTYLRQLIDNRPKPPTD